VIHDALAAYAGKRTRPLPRGVGKYSSGQPDLAQRDEEILREADGRKLRVVLLRADPDR